jgi:hypothetical protein
MGINEKYYGYWDQGESYYIYFRDADSNRVKSEELFTKQIINKFNKMGLTGTLEMYYKKSLWMWTEGTYQSVYYGMSHPSPGGYKEETPVSKYFVENLEKRDIIKWTMYDTNLLIYLLILCYLMINLIKNTINIKESIFILIFLAFIGFYLLWEIKPRYIYPSYPYLLILSYLAMSKIFKEGYLKTQLKKIKKIYSSDGKHSKVSPFKPNILKI